MTLSELKENVEKMKKSSGFLCNLFDERLHPGMYSDAGLYVTKTNDVWEVYACERGGSELESVFYTESDLCEYIFCRCKEFSDFYRWF